MTNKKMRICGILGDSFSMVCLICAVAILVSGCQPLRKKFTRKKKKEREASERFIPVLEPIDYPKRIFSPEEEYRKHYSLWKIWDKDLAQSIENDDSDKRQKFLLIKNLEELEEMRALLAGEQQMAFDLTLDKMRNVQTVYDKPAAMRNKFTVKKIVSSCAKVIRNTFSPAQVFPAQP